MNVLRNASVARTFSDGNRHYTDQQELTFSRVGRNTYIMEEIKRRKMHIGDEPIESSDYDRKNNGKSRKKSKSKSKTKRKNRNKNKNKNKSKHSSKNSSKSKIRNNRHRKRQRNRTKSRSRSISRSTKSSRMTSRTSSRSSSSARSNSSSRSRSRSTSKSDSRRNSRKKKNETRNKDKKQGEKKYSNRLEMVKPGPYSAEYNDKMKSKMNDDNCNGGQVTTESEFQYFLQYRVGLPKLYAKFKSISCNKMDNLSLLRNERELAKLNIEKRQMDHLVRHIKHAETRNKQV